MLPRTTQVIGLSGSGYGAFVIGTALKRTAIRSTKTLMLSASFKLQPATLGVSMAVTKAMSFGLSALLRSKALVDEMPLLSQPLGKVIAKAFAVTSTRVGAPPASLLTVQIASLPSKFQHVAVQPAALIIAGTSST